MAPLRHTTTLQLDLTVPSSIPAVLSHLGGRKADLVVCDGAPDVTGVHDLDAYLHHQLLLAAVTLTLAILAPGGTAVYKIFLSPLDPHAARLRQQLRVFFPGEEDQGGWFAEYADDGEDEDGEGEREVQREGDAVGEGTAPGREGEGETRRGFGLDKMGRRGGVWVRKPRSSRKGSGGEFAGALAAAGLPVLIKCDHRDPESGKTIADPAEAFLVCRNFDPFTVPLPTTFSASALDKLAQQTSGTLTLDSLAHLTGDDVQMTTEQSKRWEVLKGWVGSGDLK